MSDRKLRPHHALCAQFFVGKGYSESFVRHMYATLDELDRDGAAVTLVDGCDAICEGCPHNLGGVCETDAKVSAIDRRAIAATGLHFGDTLAWRELCAIVKQKIILPGRLQNVCRDCEWIGICEAANKESPSGHIAATAAAPDSADTFETRPIHKTPERPD